MALAFRVASGAGPDAGLYGKILVGDLAVIFGGTSALIPEPTGPMTVSMTAAITRLVAANPDQGRAMAAILAAAVACTGSGDGRVGMGVDQ
jgi:SulP family sulfate permease